MASFNCWRSSAVPDRAIVPMRSTTSSRVMPMPLSRTVSVRAAWVDLDLDVQVGHVGVEVLVPERLQPQLVQRVGGVGDQLAQEESLFE